MSGRSTRRIALWTCAGVGVVLVALIVLLATRNPSQATTFESPLLSKSAPVTKGTTLTGSTFDLSAEKGHVVVLNYFASWCPPCKTEQPQLNAFAYDQRQLATPAVLVGVIFNDENSAVAKYAAQTGVNYPIVKDPGGSLASSWGVASPPTTFIIDPQGVVVEALVGPLTADELDKKVAKYQTKASS